jgi:hypothetical protein
MGKVSMNISDKPSAVVPYTLFRTTSKSSLSENSWFCFYYNLGTMDTPLRSDDSQRDIPPFKSMELRKIWLSGRYSSGNVETSKTNRLQQEARNFSGQLLTSQETRLRNGVALYRVSQEECSRLRESVPYVKVYRYNPKHLYPSWTVTEIVAREKCGLLAVPPTAPVQLTRYMYIAHVRPSSTDSSVTLRLEYQHV